MVASTAELTAGAMIEGLDPAGPVSIVQSQPIGGSSVQLTFRRTDGTLDDQIIFADRLAGLHIIAAGRARGFDADGKLFKLAAEATRIRLAHLFDPYTAVSSSRIEPLPHQITAVYEEMLPRQPLRFLLADDPGAGKTIMAGLLIKELLIRGDLERCLVVAPGSLVEQWQDELGEKFGLEFDMLTRDRIEGSRSGNPFLESDRWIARLDQLSRNEELQAKLESAPEFDLVVCDEAHRMSASWFASEVKYTKRYQLGQRLSRRARHLLLMTATPHNGKDADFQLFMALIDGDRFEGKFRDGVHAADASDLMRRLTKEQLYRFDGTKLFPPRLAYTAKYALSDAEAALYAAVTTYVRDEMNRAEDVLAGDDRRRRNVGFALQTLQRRLASSPAAIHESLKRRLERLRQRLDAERILHRGARLAADPTLDRYSFDDPEDLDDAPEAEVEAIEETFVDHATAANTVAELEAEIAALERLEAQARALRRLGTDSKWRQLESIFDRPEMIDSAGNRRKLIVFTEPRDTLSYLAEKIRQRLGRNEAVVIIHGGIGREERRKIIEAFRSDPEVLVLVANDAAGEGVNLQRAHLMVNYDLPWNPNRIEQRFGRIHRIGQTEVCHLWNLVAHETREGQVYARLLEKLDKAREALGGRVFDVLGQLFEERSLRELLIEAIRYGERDDVQADLFRVVDGAVDQRRVRDLLDARALAHDSMDLRKVQDVRAEMERANARRLQPRFIRAFFEDAFAHFEGRSHRREGNRLELSRVPGPIRARDRQIGTGAVVLPRYERICFDKDEIDGSPPAALIAPGHPMLEAIIDLVLERHGKLLKQGTLLVDEQDASAEPRLLVFLRHAVVDGRRRKDGGNLVISERLQFVELLPDSRARNAGAAPYLDYRPATAEEVELLADVLEAAWLREGPEDLARTYAIERLAPRHLDETRAVRLSQIDKVEREVRARLKTQIDWCEARAEALRQQERAGRETRLSAENMQRRADELESRLQRRLEELVRQRCIAPKPPQLIGAALIVPAGFLRARQGCTEPADLAADAAARAVIEHLAIEAVMQAERALGFEPIDVGHENRGYDIESRDPGSERLRLIEVKGRVRGADAITITRNELLCGLNAQESSTYILALVEVEDGRAAEPRYVRRPFDREPDSHVISINFNLQQLLVRSTPAC